MLRSLTRADEPDLIQADRATIRFDPASASLDVLSIRTGADDIESAPLPQLEAALARFRGEFLAGLELPECHEFRSWCVAQREDAKALHGPLHPQGLPSVESAAHSLRGRLSTPAASSAARS